MTQCSLVTDHHISYQNFCRTFTRFLHCPACCWRPWVHLDIICIGSRAHGARLKGCLHAEVWLLESSILSPLSLGCRPGIGLPRAGERAGGVFPSFLRGATEARTLTCYLVRHWQQELLCVLPRQEGGLASRVGLVLLCVVRYQQDRRSSMDVSLNFTFSAWYY